MTHPAVPSLTLVVLAAGVGNRYGGPKQLDPVGPGGSTLMDYAAFDAARAGFTAIVFVIRPDMHQAFAPFAAGRFGGRLDVRTVHQRLDDLPAGASVSGRTRPWGTGHAVLAAESAVPGSFVVVNADDFYGAGVYRAAADLLAGGGAPGLWGVAGYRLADTLSEAGGVNRAVCRTRDGWLVSLEEVRDITRDGDGGLRGSGFAGPQSIAGDSLVSMNMWAFTPAVFDVLRREFAGFLESGDAAEREFLIPDAVQFALLRGDARVRVLEAPDRWFGLTHAADRPRVAESLAELTRAGAYPERLW